MKKNGIRCVAIHIVLFLIGVSVNVTAAEIYKYVDEDGVIHFTDSPTKDEMVLYIKTGPENAKAYPYTPDKYDDIILKASRENGLSFSLIKAIIKVESDFNTYAISRMGAKGLMQIMPKNMKELHINDPYNPYENIMGGTLYLKKMLIRFEGQLILALAAYNAGPTVVEKYNAIPPYKETRHYVDKVLKYNYKYK
ncbi:MAG: lytic transglycosylase domain-containing protein [Proteobacteria bacterium]|nr:lytic transglycosylase domain-containing protein [Pseudomonadota bacterium]